MFTQIDQYWPSQMDWMFVYYSNHVIGGILEFKRNKKNNVKKSTQWESIDFRVP